MDKQWHQFGDQFLEHKLAVYAVMMVKKNLLEIVKKILENMKTNLNLVNFAKKKLIRNLKKYWKDQTKIEDKLLFIDLYLFKQK